jgi:hypothetical protein
MIQLSSEHISHFTTYNDRTRSQLTGDWIASLGPDELGRNARSPRPAAEILVTKDQHDKRICTPILFDFAASRTVAATNGYNSWLFAAVNCSCRPAPPASASTISGTKTQITTHTARPG